MGGVVGAADGGRGHLAVEVAALDGTAENEVVAAPAVVGAAAIRAVGAAEIGGGERRDAARATEFDGGVVEGVHALADLLEETGVRAERSVEIVDLVGVRIPTAHTGEEDLAFEVQRSGDRDEIGDRLELIAEGGGGEGGGEVGGATEDGAEEFAGADGAGGERAEGGGKEVGMGAGKEVLLGGVADGVVIAGGVLEGDGAAP